MSELYIPQLFLMNDSGEIHSCSLGHGGPTSGVHGFAGVRALLSNTVFFGILGVVQKLPAFHLL